MKKLVLCLIAAIFFVSVRCYGADAKIAVVEVDEILKNSIEVLDAKGKLRERFNKMQADLREKEETLKANIAEFEKQSALYSPEAKKSKEIELKSEEEKLVATFKEYQTDIKKKEKELVESVVDQVKELVKDKGYTLVVEKKSGYVIYSAPDIDITKTLINSIDAEAKRKPANTEKKE